MTDFKDTRPQGDEPLPMGGGGAGIVFGRAAGFGSARSVFGDFIYPDWLYYTGHPDWFAHWPLWLGSIGAKLCLGTALDKGVGEPVSQA